MIENKQVTEELILSCLSTCEKTIRENAYLEKQWKDYLYSGCYTAVRLEWSGYRNKLRAALQRKYEMKKIIAMSKSHTHQVAKRIVRKVVELIDSGDYDLV